ncbi:tyrosine-type recombinase/integrase [Butyrivibrio sp. XPD2002]|uniref:tyrosine-type recombinase/integrase n=1 Tax=Butyrivibrio sp. XPD2002 TaxID=1280665 RepID=UPI000428A84E|nr:site-specific integrase [Butyrivibrio sp. XPD2002]
MKTVRNTKQYVSFKEAFSGERFSCTKTKDFIKSIYGEFEKKYGGKYNGRESAIRKQLILFVNSLNNDFNKNDVDKERMMSWGKSMTGAGSYIAWRIIFYIVLKHNFYSKTLKNEMEHIKDDYIDFYHRAPSSRSLFKHTIERNKSLCHFRIVPKWYKNNPGDIEYTELEFDTDNTYIQDLIVNFYREKCRKDDCYNITPMIRHFAESLNWKEIKDIYDFDVDTLKLQCLFYREYSEYSNFIKLFYLYIDELQGERSVFNEINGLSRLYIGSQRFTDNFLEGYFFCYLNPVDEMPKCDKWIVAPNGLEEKNSITKSYELQKIDFSSIKDPILKEALKEWFWRVNGNTVLHGRQKKTRYIMDFLNYREEVRSLHLAEFVAARSNKKDIQEEILAEEVIGYKMLWESKLTPRALDQRLAPLKPFFRYLETEGLYQVEPATYRFFSYSEPKKNDSQPVPKEELQLLYKKMEEYARLSNNNKLYFIIFSLSCITRLRINTIRDLDVDCIQENGRPGLYSVRVKEKTSHGDKRNIEIDQKTYRLIKMAEDVTSQTRKEAPESLKHYLFLVHNSRHTYNVVSEDGYRKHLKKVCKEAGISNYSSRNFRDTYMTTVINEAIKNNVNPLFLKEQTGHKKITTTLNYYYEVDLKDYIEATYKVEIGAVPIRGTISSKICDFSDEDIVNDRCGVCRNKECDVEGTADCLMCEGFFTSPEFIGAFEEAINNVSQKIESATSEHDKEHLYLIKKLYVTYLSKIYEVMTDNGDQQCN